MEFVLFKIGSMSFGIKLEDVLEIFDVSQIQHRFLFRDKDLDVVYLSVLFGIENSGQLQDGEDTSLAEGKKNVIVSRINGIEKAIVVDSVSEIKKIEAWQIKELPELIKTHVGVQCFWGVVRDETATGDDGLNLLVDLNRLGTYS